MDTYSLRVTNALELSRFRKKRALFTFAELVDITMQEDGMAVFLSYKVGVMASFHCFRPRTRFIPVPTYRLDATTAQPMAPT